MIDPSIPLVDLHRHLDGNILPETIWKLAQKNRLSLPANSIEEVAALTQIQDKTSDLLAFLEKLDYGVSVLATIEDCYTVAYENMRNAKDTQLDYVELRFSPYYMGRNHNLDLVELVAAVADGVRDGIRDFGVKANLIGILSRTFGAEICMGELDALIANKEKIVALDLAGDELNFPAPMFEDHFKKGRDAGWHITVHAGEADGPESIWQAISLLGAERIGHGVKAIEDPKLMDYLATNNIPIESCPTSNYQTATVADTAHHPMKRFLENGIKVTLNTDDPAVSNIDLIGEYEVAFEQIGFNKEQLKTIQMNGLNAAFLSESEKSDLICLKANQV